MTRKTIGIALVLCGAFGACTTPDVQALSPGALQESYLEFVVDGLTTREDVLLRLGDPSGIFEDARILTYVLRIDDEDGLHVLTRRLGSGHETRWRPGLYSLVLVFDAGGVLERHSVVVGE